jgi:hypothetical protein
MTSFVASKWMACGDFPIDHIALGLLPNPSLCPLETSDAEMGSAAFEDHRLQGPEQ